MSGDPKRLGSSYNYRLTVEERHLLSVLLMKGISEQSRLPDGSRQPHLRMMQSLLDRFATG